MLSEADFDAFFEAVHGHGPFPWQRRLAALVLEQGTWPSTLDLPTSSGKTGVLDAAVFTLAASATERRMPRRIVFVVDRRVIVDQAAERAAAIKDALEPSEGEPVPILRIVRDALRRLGGSAALHTAVLRGGIPRDNAWARKPDQPTILLSTVDQVGSRLLFRGYGVTEEMQAVHAGLLGNDVLFFLDEVHLSRPFAETLDQARELSRAGEVMAHLPPWEIVEMSATPGAASADTFSLDEDDHDPVLAPLLVRRLDAVKRARLVDVPSGGVPAAVLPDVVARELAGLGGATVAVVVNRVATARAVARRLSRDHRTVLLTGRMRPFDRDDVLDRCRDRVKAGRERGGEEDRLVVVATQSIEAGADFDFDAMITECAPIDSLRQRFGRLDRLGDLAATGHPARAVVLAPKSTVAARDPDPVYGEAIRETYDWLKARFKKADFDVGAESADLRNAPSETLAPSRAAPLLLPTHLNTLVQTSPRPAIDQPVAPWLHGEQEQDVDVSIVWRADLTQWHLADREDPSRAVDVVAACPPGSPEALQVPLSAVRAWLRGDSEATVADVEGVRAEEAAGGPGRGRPVLRWRGQEKSEVGDASTLRPGDTLVVPASYGGISKGNWDPGSKEPVTDLGDRVQLVQRRRATIRFRIGCLPTRVPTLPDVTRDTERDDVQRELDAWFAAARGADVPSWFREIVAALAAPRFAVRRGWVVSGPDDASHLVVSTKVVSDGGAAAVDDFDGSDAVNSFIDAEGQVHLLDHLGGVGALAAEFAANVGLPQSIVDDLRLAGELHDLGKADPRFQQWLHGGDEVTALTAGDLLAKSATLHSTRGAALDRARERSGYPKGTRHELLSVALVQESEHRSRQAHDWDLVLHVIATHHGYCRPLPPVQAEAASVDVSVDVNGGTLKASSAHRLHRLDAGVVDRFSRLVRRYGWWQLALLEAVLRLADHRRSQQEEAARKGVLHA